MDDTIYLVIRYKYRFVVIKKKYMFFIISISTHNFYFSEYIPLIVT